MLSFVVCSPGKEIVFRTKMSFYLNAPEFKFWLFATNCHCHNKTPNIIKCCYCSCIFHEVVWIIYHKILIWTKPQCQPLPDTTNTQIKSMKEASSPNISWHLMSNPSTTSNRTKKAPKNKLNKPKKSKPPLSRSKNHEERSSRSIRKEKLSSIANS